MFFKNPKNLRGSKFNLKKSGAPLTALFFCGILLSAVILMTSADASAPEVRGEKRPQRRPFSAFIEV